MTTHLFLYRVKLNIKHGLISIKYAENNKTKYALFENKYLSNYEQNLNQHLVMYVLSNDPSSYTKLYDSKLIEYTKLLIQRNNKIGYTKNTPLLFKTEYFDYIVCNYNKSSKTLRITSKDYPGQVFIYYQNIENKLFSIKRLVEYDLSNIQNQILQNTLSEF